MTTQILLPTHLYSTSSGEVDHAQLERLVTEYPYCSTLFFYLLHSTSKAGNTTSSIAQKTALFFNNTNWLNWQLYQTDQILKNWKIEVLPPIQPLKEKEEALIPFEPLHVVDYFASQGIIITEEALAGDKLGKQLKSFTEWLKTMKKIQTGKLEPVSELANQKIQTSAEKSNTDTEVVTEAMADVLEKQGKIEKAIETYEKLSLINPAKNAYFAAKINSLKGL